MEIKAAILQEDGIYSQCYFVKREFLLGENAAMF
jgi:hypothetical protein